MAYGSFVHREAASCQKMEYHDLEELSKYRVV
jgi:hypothetical protein